MEGPIFRIIYIFANAFFLNFRIFNYSINLSSKTGSSSILACSVDGERYKIICSFGGFLTDD